MCNTCLVKACVDHSDWHNCDGQISQHLMKVRSVSNLAYWALFIPGAKHCNNYYPIKYCPVCGELLPEIEV